MPADRLDLDFVRRQFPPLGNGWAFFENAGGSYVPQSVIDRVRSYMTEAQVQPAWTFGPSADASARIAHGHRAVAELINADPDEVIVGPSTTQNIYVLAQALRPRFRPGDELIVTNLDHEANNGAWRRLAESGVTIKEWRFDPESGALRQGDLDILLTDRTRLVCFSHCSNVTGTINDVPGIVRKVHAAGALACVDGVAFAPHRPVDVKALDVDFYAFSAYKVFGPHLGILYGKREHLLAARGQNHFFIGEDEIPLKLNPGGPNHELTAGLVGVADYFDGLYHHHFDTPEDDQPNSFHGRAARVYALMAAHEERLADRLLTFLRGKPSLRLIGCPTASGGQRAPTISFAVPGRPSRDIQAALERRQIAVGYGNFYAYRCVESLGLSPEDGVLRVGMAHYNSVEEVDRLIDALGSIL